MTEGSARAGAWYGRRVAPTPRPPTEPPEPTNDGGFAALGLGPGLVAALAALGYEEPTPIQRAAIPPLLQGRDVLGQAATGTGKTAAFALPILQRLKPGDVRPFEAAALVLVPTRELAMQVAEAVYVYGKSLGIGVLPVYGGQEFARQVARLKRGVDVVVATPGRALDHLRRGTFRVDRIRYVVLDEADEMLDLGFAEDLDAILSGLPKDRQTALFAATLPARIASIAERHLRHPVRIRIAGEKAEPGEVPKVRQTAYVVSHQQKDLALRRLLDAEDIHSAIIFCRTRTEVDALTDGLLSIGARAEPLHGGMTQEQRERVLRRFRGHKADLLIATDVAARGLHIENLSHVINYDLPTSPEAYVHRIGRTGRAGREGVAISLVEPRERRLVANIERLTRQKIAYAALPTLEELETLRLGQTRERLREAIQGGELEPYRSVVEALAKDFSAADIAAAAVKMLHAGAGEGAEQAEELTPVAEEAPHRPRREAPSGPGRERPGPPEGRVTLFINQGRNSNIRPADIVGAIANEAKVPAKAVGAIDIHERFTAVQVPEEEADRIIEALRLTTLRGRKVKVERDRGR